AYIAVASELFHTAARRALDRAGLRASDIDAVVSVSSTGIATPTLEARIADALGFRPDILRIPLFGLGCAGGVSGLALAQRLADADPNMRVLLVVVELCSLAFRCDRLSKANIVATALFGDGAAAAVISSRDGGEGTELLPGCQHTWPHTLNMMGWKVDPNGFEVIFDRAIPPFARRHLRPVIEDFLGRLKVEKSAVSRFSFHPGGAKVLQAIESAFGLRDGALDIERQVLREHGNMSAPTALFVLKQMLEEGRSGLSLLTALGPGFSAASLPLMARA
ncbi:MAG: type III polyketide synthase, partial [Alphaproteobacteria bacterium]